MKPIKFFLLLLCLIFSCPSFALRCGHELVDIGDNKNDVYDKCGEPESINSHIERRGASNIASIRRRLNPGLSFNYGQEQYAEVDVMIDEWIYDFGRRRLQHYLRFENGSLKEIKTLGRGD